MQPPFVRQRGEGIRESISGEVDRAGPAKAQLETQIEMALMLFWNDQRERVQKELEPRIPESRKGVEPPASFWKDESKKLLSVLLPYIQEGAEGGVAIQQEIVEGLGISVDWTLPFTEAADWARGHAGEMVKGVTDTTKGRIRSAVTNWIATEDRTLPDLWRQLMEDHAFSAARAKMIAATEATRAYAEGEMAGARQLEKDGYFEYVKQWQTVMDDLVCPICNPLQGQTVNGTKGQFDSTAGMLDGPPAHPGCRCWINMVPQVPK